MALDKIKFSIGPHHFVAETEDGHFGIYSYYEKDAIRMLSADEEEMIKAAYRTAYFHGRQDMQVEMKSLLNIKESR